MPLPIAAWIRTAVDWIRYPALRWWIHRHFDPAARKPRDNLILAVVRFCHTNRPTEGYYFEFGCHEAHTMRAAWKHTRHLFNWHYVAFDSFEGLPDLQDIDRLPIWHAGKLKTSEEAFVQKAGLPRDRLTTVKGFYDQSLTPELQRKLLPRKAAVVYVDCDLYHSTIPVLEFIIPFLQRGTVIVFDDWSCFHADPGKGERRAWREFCEKHPDLQFSPLHDLGEFASFVFLGDAT